MTKIKQDKTAQRAAVELHGAALDQAVGGGFVGGVFVAAGDIDGDGRGGNTVYVGGASGGVWKTTNF